MNAENKIHKICIFGAAGCLGKFLIKHLDPYTNNMILIDPLFSETKGNIYNWNLTTIENDQKEILLKDASVVIFAVANRILFKLFKNILPYVSNSTLIVDTSSTKCIVEQFYSSTLLNKKIKPQILSIDPLFRPSSKTTDSRIAFFSLYPRQELYQFIDLLKRLNFDVFQSNAKEHDTALSIIQVAVHALIIMLGEEIAASDTPFDTLLKYSTPPFRIIIFLLRRIVSGTPEVYWDIQTSNLFATQTRKNLIKHLGALTHYVDSNNMLAFENCFGAIKMKTKSNPNDHELNEIFNAVNHILKSYLK